MKTDRRTSGIPALDNLLGGGLEVRTITQIYGEPASGKSTLCMIAAVSCLRAGQPVVYIDSEGFSIERFRQIAGEDTEKIADHLFLFEPLDFEHQGTMIAEAEKVLKTHKPGLLVMDSATALYRTDLEKGTGCPAGPHQTDDPPARVLQALRDPGHHHQPGVHGHRPRTPSTALGVLPLNTSQKSLSGSKRPTPRASAGPGWSSTAPARKGHRSVSRSWKKVSG